MKLTISKSKNSEHFYSSHSYIDKNGKSTTRTYRKLGSLKELQEKLGTDRDGVIAWCKQQVAEDTRKYKEENEQVVVSLSPSMRIKKDQQREFNCGYLFLQSIMTSLRLDNTCRNIKNRHDYQYDLKAILDDLVFARVLDPGSKLSSYKYCQSLLEPPKYELHDVYRALSVLAQESDYIQSELYKNSLFLRKRDTSVLYYDCTNYYFEIEQESGDRKYGKSKENRPNPITGMGLFMDTDGIPLAFDLHKGNMNEQLTLKPLEQKVIRDFGISHFIFCSDGGLGSSDNKHFNSFGGRSYVVTQSLKKLKQEIREEALSPKYFRKPGHREYVDISQLDEDDPEVFNTVYYKEIPFATSKLPTQTLIVTYSPKYKAYQEAIRNGQIDRAKNMISSGGKLKKNRKNPNDPARFITKTSTTENGEVADREYCTLDLDKINEEKMYDGFYAVATDLEDAPEAIIAINRRRWQIEECFRIMKTDFEARPVHLSRDDRIKAHFLTCFMALLVYRLLEIKLDKKYTCEQILSTLRNMKVVELEGCGYIPAYTRTELTDLLHEKFDFNTDTQVIKKRKMRSIIKQTKEI